MGVRLIGATAAVTGAGRGIGRATAEALAGAGARVALGDLDADLAREAAAAIGGSAVGLPLDVTSRESFAGFLDAAAEAFGPIDVVVNNAGIMHVGRFLDEDDRDTRGQVEVNLMGVLMGMKLVLPAMVARGSGAIVNIASVSGKSGFPGFTTYSATKHAVVGASDAVRGELAGTGVSVSVVLPMIVDTELGTGLQRTSVRLQTPDSVARAVVHALRTGSSHVYVPRYLAAVQAALAPLPPKARAVVTGWLGANRVVGERTQAAREQYHARARASAESALRRH